MNPQKRTIKEIARSYRRNPDDLLVRLWYEPSFNEKFGYLTSENSIITKRDYDLVKRVAFEMVEKDILLRKPRVSQVADRPKTKEYNFSQLGKKLESLSFLTKNDVLAIHEELSKDSYSAGDPIFLNGVKDEGLLESALFHPQTSFSSILKYPTVESSGGALVYALANNHAFHDGNKRTALVSLLVFLDKYNVSLICTDDELFKFSLDIVRHELTKGEDYSNDSEIFNITNWILGKSKVMRKGEMALPFRRLRRRLGDFGCIYNEHRGGFERVAQRSLLRLDHNLFFKMPATTIRDSEEIDVGTINRLRKSLKLDNGNGVDTDAFYYGSEYIVSDFVNQYRNLLKRLSRF